MCYFLKRGKLFSTRHATLLKNSEVRTVRLLNLKLYSPPNLRSSELHDSDFQLVGHATVLAGVAYSNIT